MISRLLLLTVRTLVREVLIIAAMVIVPFIYLEYLGVPQALKLQDPSFLLQDYRKATFLRLTGLVLVCECSLYRALPIKVLPVYVPFVGRLDIITAKFVTLIGMIVFGSSFYDPKLLQSAQSSHGEIVLIENPSPPQDALLVDLAPSLQIEEL